MGTILNLVNHGPASHAKLATLHANLPASPNKPLTFEQMPMMQKAPTSQNAPVESATNMEQKTDTAGKQNNQTGQSTTTASVVNEASKKATTNRGGVHLKLSDDALHAITQKSIADYNKIVDTASAQSGTLGKEVINRFKANTIDQA
ncbi:MAG: hypothetical protein PHY47_16470 [Lachnospiraceae bacterium]|nr:hypothetical protein [Lachnospiraceae bacterium]